MSVTADATNTLETRSAAGAPTFWSVLLTHFSDDFKRRGGDWSSHDGPELFTSRDKAERYLRQKLVEWCSDQVACHKRKDEDDDYEERLRRARHSLAEVEEIAEELAQGTFIPRTLAWSLQELQLKDDDVDSESDSEPDSDTDENEQAGSDSD